MNQTTGLKAVCLSGFTALFGCTQTQDAANHTAMNGPSARIDSSAQRREVSASAVPNVGAIHKTRRHSIHANVRRQTTPDSVSATIIYEENETSTITADGRPIEEVLSDLRRLIDRSPSIRPEGNPPDAGSPSRRPMPSLSPD